LGQGWREAPYPIRSSLLDAVPRPNRKKYNIMSKASQNEFMQGIQSQTPTHLLCSEPANPSWYAYICAQAISLPTEVQETLSLAKSASNLLVIPLTVSI
jgi:hypothetical protein